MNTFKCKCDVCGKSLIRLKANKVKMHFCDNQCKSEYQRTLKPVSREWLYDHYITQGLDTTKIAHLVNRDPKSVWNWLKDFDIPTRSRGGFTSPNCFKKGQVNLFKGRKHTEETKKKMSDVAKRDGRVPYDPKVGSYMKGRKGADTPGWKGGITPERQSLYSSKEWSSAVKSVWKRDKAICQRCGKLHNAPEVRGTFHIHHIISFKNKNTRADVNNLVLLCKECHSWVHSSGNVDKKYIEEIT